MEDADIRYLKNLKAWWVYYKMHSRDATHDMETRNYNQVKALGIQCQIARYLLQMLMRAK